MRSIVGPYLPSGLMPKAIQLRIVAAVIVQFFAVQVGGAAAGGVVQLTLTSTTIFWAREIAS